MTYYLHGEYFPCKNPTFCDQDPDPDPHGSTLVWLRIRIRIWVHIEVKSQIRIRIRIETNADPKYRRIFPMVNFNVLLIAVYSQALFEADPHPPSEFVSLFQLFLRLMTRRSYNYLCFNMMVCNVYSQFERLSAINIICTHMSTV